MLLQKESNINQDKISEYKKILDEVDFIDEKIAYITNLNVIDGFNFCIYILPTLPLLFLCFFFDLDLVFYKIAIYSFMIGCLLLIGIGKYLDIKFFIDGKFNHSKKRNWLNRKLIFFTNKREKKYKELLDQKASLLLKIRNLEIDFKALEILFEEQKSKLDISSDESVKYVNAYNSYKNNLKENNIIEALRTFTNYFENKDLSSKNLYNYI